jgi:CheY-like chemotaxis protein
VTAPRRILVVDDNEEHQYFFRRVLGAAGYALAAAHTGEDAIAVASASPPDLIILDLVLPRMSGWEAARQLKSDPRTARVPVFLVTAYPHHASHRWEADSECDALLVKPIEPTRLLSEVERWIAPA